MRILNISGSEWVIILWEECNLNNPYYKDSPEHKKIPINLINYLFFIISVIYSLCMWDSPLPCNPFRVNSTKWSNTLKELFQANCLSVFDHFVGLACEGLIVQHIEIIL